MIKVQENRKWIPAFLIVAVAPSIVLPFVLDPYVQSKNALLGILFLIGFGLVGFERLKVPELSKANGIALSTFCVALFASNVASYERGFHWPFWLETLSYVAGFFYFGALMSDQKFWSHFQNWLLVSSALVLSTHYYQLGAALSSGTLETRRVFASSFGENNLMSQYMVLAYAGILTKAGRLAWGLRVLLVSVILFNQSRSATIGVLMILAAQFWKDRRWHHVGALVLSAILATGTAAFSQQKFGEGAQTGVRGLGSWQVRLEVAKESLALIKSKPFGLGPDHFQFGAIPYLQGGETRQSETEIYSNPHSEILRLATSGGWLTLLAGIAIALQFASRLFKRTARTSSVRPLSVSNSSTFTSNSAIPILILVGLIPEFLFQFPYDIGTTFTFALVAFAGLGVSWKENPLLVPMQKIWFFPLLAVLALGQMTVLGSGILAKQAMSASQAVRACSMNPWNWQACELAIVKLEADQNPLAAKVVIDDQLRRYPQNFLALRHLSRFHFATGEFRVGCEVLQAEAELMKAAFTASEFYKGRCSNY